MWTGRACGIVEAGRQAERGRQALIVIARARFAGSLQATYGVCGFEECLEVVRLLTGDI